MPGVVGLLGVNDRIFNVPLIMEGEFLPSKASLEPRSGEESVDSVVSTVSLRDIADWLEVLGDEDRYRGYLD